MYLKKLIIRSHDGTEIRNILFKKGLNIILGIPFDGGSTNSLGKTTLIRSLNFCLGGQFKEFYTDQEDKNIENQNIKSFLISNHMRFELFLGVDLEKDLNSDIKITRIVESDEKTEFKILNYVNDEKLTEKKFLSKLKGCLFKSNVDKPTFRTLIPKFLRMEDNEISRILKYLILFTSDDDYSQIWFTLFGFKDLQMINKRNELKKALKKVKSDLTVVKKIIPAGAKQKLSLLEKVINEKEVLRDNFKIDEKSKHDEDVLGEINIRISDFEEKISSLISSRNVLVSREVMLKQDKFEEDPSLIETIYSELELFELDSHIQNKFKETVTFHNSMLHNELLYVQSRIKKIDEDILNCRELVTVERKKYNEILEKLGKQGSLAQYTELNNEILKLASEKSEISVIFDKQKDLLEKQKKFSNDLDNAEKIISNYIIDFEEKIDVFNEYFSSHTEALYGEKWLIAFNQENYMFNVTCMESNAGTGKKQNIVTAFDIAYMKFIRDERINLPFPNFATQDKVEVVDADDLKKIRELLKNTDGQFIFPLIKDKFDSLDEDAYRDVILTLHKDDRFFKIP